MKGIVKFFDKDKHFGFIRTQSDNIFFHGSNLTKPYLPVKGEWVQFEIKQGREGPEAINIKHPSD